MTKAWTNNNNHKGFQFWKQDNHPIVLDSNKLMEQKLDYIHDNPVRPGFVDKAGGFLYSSARDYAGQKGLIDVSFIK